MAEKENEEASSRRADAADRRATAADLRATGADVRATGADVRASAADVRSDKAIAAATTRFVQSLEPLERKLDRVIRARNRIIAGLLALLFLMAGVGYADLYSDRRRAFRACNERIEANHVLVDILNEAYAAGPPDPNRRALTDRLIQRVPRDVKCYEPKIIPWL